MPLRLENYTIGDAVVWTATSIGELMRALLTGSEGFIGSHLAEQLVRSGREVRALVQYNSTGSIGWLSDLDKQVLSSIEIVHGDVRDPEHTRALALGCDEIFHLAALIAIPYSYVAPRSYFETNAMGTLNVLEAAKQSGASRVLVTSTSEVYGTAQYAPIDEKHPLQGQSPYSASKISADKIAESYHRCFDLPVVTVRPFNTFGPRQSQRALIPSVISQMLKLPEKKLILGDLTPTRDFNYVGDVAKGFQLIAESDDAVGEVINLATGVEWSVLQVAAEVAGLLGIEWSEEMLEQSAERMRPAKSEVFRLIGSSDKAQKIANWQPETDFRAGLEKTVAWFKKNQALLNEEKNGVIL
jgi:NAD dependent epimerase/dehydratase